MIAKHFIMSIGIFTITGFLTLSCDNVTSSSGSTDNANNIESIAGKANSNKTTSALSTCKNAGDTGMTAVYVNQSLKDVTIDFDNHNCDMAIYFDENAPRKASVRNTTVIQETGDSGESTGVWNNGADVTVTRSTFITDFSGRFVPIRFDEGAKGTISSNELTGTHRVGILARGTETSVGIKSNSIVGSGAKTSGWAENGIQIDQGAAAEVINNEITGHWWDGESNFGSTALLILGTNSKVTNNTLHNNEFSIYLVGNDNRVTGNRTSSEIESQSSYNFKAYGALVGGSDNHLAGNNFNSEESTGAIGVYVFPGTSENNITGNRINGFDTFLYDGGDDSMIRGTPAPPQEI
ncbi:parallel beta-helix repeat (two copies) [Fodinibius roseus]|uniref:Parallel beta-helix repeat (Two copies) n=1 Tax=Fodinibius roseus TaxID=1194090 RepID=A0A1M5G0U1_9BACT|nr:hypothetical protein [Fodinibius roseus]SHF97052.1 parallel beta-helix repeat (two copies) [Fodinibius roseus]